jgi:hypothetical protein
LASPLAVEGAGHARQPEHVQARRGVEIADLAVDGERVAPIDGRRVSGDQGAGEAEALLLHPRVRRIVSGGEGVAEPALRHRLAGGLAGRDGALQDRQPLGDVALADAKLGQRHLRVDVVRAQLDEPRKRALGPREIARRLGELELPRQIDRHLLGRRGAAGDESFERLGLQSDVIALEAELELVAAERVARVGAARDRLSGGEGGVLGGPVCCANGGVEGDESGALLGRQSECAAADLDARLLLLLLLLTVAARRALRLGGSGEEDGGAAERKRRAERDPGNRLHSKLPPVIARRVRAANPGRNRGRSASAHTADR